jgi:tetratricopeptide (TPR) repeat protein
MIMRQLFIGYSSSDTFKVDKIARDLSLLKDASGAQLYSTWQDKHNLPPASPNWWDAIVDAIIASDVFVFNMSRASLESDVCRAELDYAHQRNRPIIPVVLEGEFILDPKSGKYNITYWNLVPDWLGERQFLFYIPTEFYGRFQEAMAVFERHPPRDIDAPRPLNPDNKGEHRSNHTRYAQAYAYAEKLAFVEARKYFSALVSRNDADYGEMAVQWLELLHRYEELVEIVNQNSPAVVFKKKWSAYTGLFPKDFIDGLFDPKDLKSRYDDRDNLRKVVTLTGIPKTFSEWVDWALVSNNLVEKIQRLNQLSEIKFPNPQRDFTNPQKSEIYFQLGSIYAELQANETAVKCFKRALLLNPDDQRIKQHLKSLDVQFPFDELQRNSQAQTINTPYKSEESANNQAKLLILNALPKLRIFISYSRNREDIKRLGQELEKLGQMVWFDNELQKRGGQSWWNNIILEIQKADVVIISITRDALDSYPCELERDYALKLGKQLLPVVMKREGEDWYYRELPQTLAEIQTVNFTAENALDQLRDSISNLPPTKPMPDPMPAPPPVPVHELNVLSEQMRNQDTEDNQLIWLTRLKKHLNDPKIKHEAYSLLQRFSRLRSLYKYPAHEADELIAKYKPEDNQS